MFKKIVSKKMDTFNTVGKYIETIKLKDIGIGEYKMVELRSIDTKFGPSIIANIIVDCMEYQVFLPRKYSSLSDQDIKDINNMENCYLKYNGKKCGKDHMYYDLKLVKGRAD